MDKVVFFDSLSFLTKLLTEVWPPKVTGFSSNDVLCQPGFNLSVEVDNCPILLKNADADPAMFVSDLVILEPILGSPSSASTSLSQGTPKSTTRRSYSQEGLQVEAHDKQQLVLRLDQSKTYRVDLSRCLDISMQKGSRSLPASIVIQFHECSFRFFSEDNSVFSEDNSDRLQAAWHKIQKLPRTSLSIENVEQMSKSEAVKITKRKLRTLEKGRQELVDTFLRQRVPLSPSKICQQLNAAALSLSYASPHELELAVASHHELLESTQMELENLLTAYFPRAKQRRSEHDSKQQPPMEQCIQTAHDLLRTQYSYLEQRHELAFLPCRR